MFSIKILNKKENRNIEFVKTVKNISSYILNKLSFSDSKILSDSSCIEIISGKELAPNGDHIVVELLIKKYIIINNEDLNDRSKIDEHLVKIKHFCEQAKNIEEIQYFPINMRS